MNKAIINILNKYINARKKIEQLDNILFEKYDKLHNNFDALDFLRFCENYPTINDKIKKLTKIKNTLKDNFYIEIEKLSNKELFFLMAEFKKDNNFEVFNILDNYTKFKKV